MSLGISTGANQISKGKCLEEAAASGNDIELGKRVATIVLCVAT
jgi:hypothetical protein